MMIDIILHTITNAYVRNSYQHFHGFRGAIARSSSVVYVACSVRDQSLTIERPLEIVRCLTIQAVQAAIDNKMKKNDIFIKNNEKTTY